MKVKQFLDSESVTQWGTDDLRENRAGRLSESQRRRLETQLYKLANLGLLLLGLAIMSVLISLIMVVYSLQGDLGRMIVNGFVIVGLIIPLWAISNWMFESAHLLMDLRDNTVERDCGVARLETRRQSPLFRERHYVLLGQKRYRLNHKTHIHEGETACIYFMPHTHLVTTVDKLPHLNS